MSFNNRRKLTRQNDFNNQTANGLSSNSRKSKGQIFKRPDNSFFSTNMKTLGSNLFTNYGSKVRRRSTNITGKNQKFGLSKTSISQAYRTLNNHSNGNNGFVNVGSPYLSNNRRRTFKRSNAFNNSNNGRKPPGTSI